MNWWNEIISVIIDGLTYENWDEKVIQMLTKMKNEDYFYINTLKASVEHEFREYLFHVTAELFSDIIGRIVLNVKMGEDEIKFIAEFYAFGIVGMIISWVQHGMKETPGYITAQLKNLALGTGKFATARFQIKNPIQKTD